MYIEIWMPQQFAEHAWTSHHGVNWETKVLNFAISGMWDVYWSTGMLAHDEPHRGMWIMKNSMNRIIEGQTNTDNVV